jgi:diacylglycerol kinase (ATP)
MRATLLVNPSAGSGGAGRVADTVAARLRTVVDKLEVRVSRNAEHARALASAAVADGMDVLAVLGGDGMAHVGANACAQSSTALAVVPAGAGNDLAGALGLPEHTDAAVNAVAQLLRGNVRRQVDLGRVVDGVAQGRWWATVLCAGFDSAVTERANRMHWPRGPRRYDLAVLAELARLHPLPLVIDTENGRVELVATLVAIGNGDRYGGGLRICPDARIADGLFDVTVVSAVSRRRLVRVFPKVRTGGHIGDPAVRTLRARTVRLKCRGWLGYADGEPLAALPLTTECVPRALQVVAPNV